MKSKVNFFIIILFAIIIILYAYTKKVLHEMTIQEVNIFQAEILEYAKKKIPNELATLRASRASDDNIVKALDSMLKEYLKEIKAKRPKEDTDEEEGDKNVGVDALDQATSKKK